MATKKSAKSAATTKKAAPKKAATKTTVKTVSSAKAKSQTVAASASKSSKKFDTKISSNVINIVLAELVGTFILVLVALLTATDVVPLFVGLTLVVVFLAIGAVSGSHINPAVTFGLWATRKVKTIMVPFYWVAQFLGAMAAVVVMNAVAGTKLNLSFAHFNEFSWPIFWIELIGTSVFLFGLTAALRSKELSNTGKALGVGLSLFLGLVVATSLYAPARSAAITEIQNSDKAKTSTIQEADLPHQILVSGATLNPAVALATTETPASTLLGTSGTSDAGTTHYSRLGWEVIVGTFIGAAVGANLTYVIDRRYKS